MLAGTLFGISSTDPQTLVQAALALLAVTLIWFGAGVCGALPFVFGARMGFADALFESVGGTVLEVTAECFHRLDSRDQQVIIYRILQEALHNIYKHARARSVAVSIRCKPHEVALQVRDDGCGFDLDEARQRHVADRGLGLGGCQQ